MEKIMKEQGAKMDARMKQEEKFYKQQQDGWDAYEQGRMKWDGMQEELMYLQ